MSSINTSDNTWTLQKRPREMKLLITPFLMASSSIKSPTPPSPPPSPCPWLWRCHSCYTIYRLAVTRRCLDCDHTFCLGDATGANPPQKSKKRKRGGHCKAEFDYNGWKTLGAWRRTVLLNGDKINYNSNSNLTTSNLSNETNWGDEYKANDSHAAAEPFKDQRERLFLRKQHNCFLHCDFPSECHHSLFRAQQEGRPILREALALDAAREAEEKEGRKVTRRLTVQEYKQRRNARRRAQGAVVVVVSTRDLPTLDEEEADEEDNNSVSPCSPTSPDPPGDLMREVAVSPVERDGTGDNDELPPVSPSSGRRRSLLVATDTPADFAAQVSFEDTYSDEDGDDEHEEEEEEEETRRTKSRRKVAQLTGESFGPFVFDTTSPTSPTSPSATHAEDTDLQAAYSEQAWFTSSSTTTASEPLSPKSPERMGKRDRMLALLGRRSPAPSSPTQQSFLDIILPPARNHPHPQQQQQQHADAKDGEWDSYSDTSSSSSSSSAASTASSAASGGGMFIMDDDDTDADADADADGDIPMRDVAAATLPAKEEGDEDLGSPRVTPPGERGAGAGEGEGSDGAEEDLRVLLRMRNAFMRGDMI